MSAVLQEPRSTTAPATPPTTPAPGAAPRPTPAAPVPAPASTAWGGDRIALAVWLTGATIMAFLLLKDLVLGIVAR